ncbi:hypothetical protein HJC23_014038 [Cyclotella cryptica]|uniref:Uncharacterized protein n=1 Tax=Cyclotella cryptica TaxID=29204 RepID=A0ABD3QZ97_9STRA|eukprot:CCRYP_002428-RF/>CCRYP_002428-RF protein AED:0.17 eAED:0.17 QI:71/1/1/1/0.36/0.25/12/7858/291
MALSYHELTYNQHKDPKAQRQQFLVICLIMAVLVVHSALNAGILAPLSITRDVFPGGEFVFKLMTNDYVASFGAVRTISSDLGIDENGVQQPRDGVDFLYTVFLDDPSIVPGGKTRFASGALLQKGDGGMRSRLLEANKSIPPDVHGTQSKNTRYEVAKLPKVTAAVAQHPFTDGVWSALLMKYKIVPAFKKHAKHHNTRDEIIISTCSETENMCTFYMPLSKVDKFYVGKPTAAEYAKRFDKDMGFLEKIGIDTAAFSTRKIPGVDLSNVWRGSKKALGLKDFSKGKEEL